MSQPDGCREQLPGSSVSYWLLLARTNSTGQDSVRICEMEAVLKAERETRNIEFKSVFDVDSPGEWCELIKDLVAIANSGGGYVVVGVDNNGKPTGADITRIVALDPAKLADKIGAYIGGEYFDCEVSKQIRGEHPVAVLKISGAAYPFVFSRPGSYAIDAKQQKTAFAVGTVYFRRGAKSSPGTNDDLRRFVDSKLVEIRNQWKKGVRKVIQAPTGSTVNMLPPGVVEVNSPGATPIRIVDDPKAPAFRVEDPDITHPYRAKEVLAQLKLRIKDVALTPFDLLSARRVHGIEQKRGFCYQSKFASPRYSPQYVDWLVQQYELDGDFFKKSRALYAL